MQPDVHVTNIMPPSSHNGNAGLLSQRPEQPLHRDELAQVIGVVIGPLASHTYSYMRAATLPRLRF
jgi:hypothetical protein